MNLHKHCKHVLIRIAHRFGLRFHDNVDWRQLKHSNITNIHTMSDRNKQLIDLRITVQKGINTLTLSYESEANTQCRHSLILAKMWLGKLLEALGSSSPYPHANDPQSSIVDPSADMTSEVIVSPLEKIPAVKFIRNFIQKDLINALDNINVAMRGGKTDMAYRQAYVYLSEAKMWLGMELQALASPTSVDTPATSTEVKEDTPKTKPEPKSKAKQEEPVE